MNFKSLALNKAYRPYVFALCLGIALIAAHLYQMEIITIWISQGKYTFEFPFYLEKLLGFQNGINIMWARDFWYVVNVLGAALVFYAGYGLGVTVVFDAIENSLVDLVGEIDETETSNKDSN